MIKYKFYKRSNELACEVIDGNITYFLNFKDAKRKMMNLSQRYYRNIQMDNYKATFYGNDIEMTIEDFSNLLIDYFSYGGKELIANIKQVLKRGKAKVMDKLVTTAKRTGAAVVCAAGVITCLLFDGKTASFGEGLKADAEVIPIEYETDDIAPSRYQTEEEFIEELDAQVEDIINKHKIVSLEPDEAKTGTISSIENDLNIDCEEKGYSSDVEYVVQNYGDLIKKAADTYGISFNLLTALLTHESHGVHPENLMQIVFSSHSKPDKDEIKRAYNCITGAYEDFVLTYNPSKYKNEDGTYKCTVYTKKDLEDPEKNIMCGAAIFASYYQKYCGENICAAIICYNQGPGTFNGVINRTADNYNVDKNDILYNPADITFMDEVRKLRTGDPKYLENVMQYVTDSEDGIYMTNADGKNVYSNTLYISKGKNIIR